MHPVVRVSIKYQNNLRTQHSIFFIFLVLDFIVHFTHYNITTKQYATKTTFINQQLSYNFILFIYHFIF
jgi:hypothetical protein